jgi:23S rRNA (uridine2552-2'-O)-methyltransferase
VLNPGGTFLAKVFQGGADAALMTQLKHDLVTVKHVKPEGFLSALVLAMGFRRRPKDRPVR